MLFMCYSNCVTCKDAKKWLDSHGIEYESRDIKEQNPTYEELKEWHSKSSLPLSRFFNTSGVVYKEMVLKDKLPNMTEEEQLRLLATNGMLVKRPIIVTDDFVLVAFRPKIWEEKLLK